MKKKIFLTILMMVSLVSLNLFAETAYQKEVEKIIQKYYSLVTYGYVRGLSMEDEITISFYGSSAVRLKALNFSDRKEASQLIERMDKELEKARSLMVEEDYFREWKNSDHGQLSLLIKNGMGETYQKDQFETQAQYQERVQREIKKTFIENCIKVYAEMDKSLNVIVIPENYNPETQTYILKVKETYSVFKNDFSISFETTVKMRSEQARFLKETTIANKDIINSEWNIADNSVYANVEVQMPEGFKLSLKKKSTSKPLCFEFKKLQYNLPALDNYKWCYTEVIGLYNYWDDQLQKDVEIFNQKYISNPYSPDKKPLIIHLNKSNRFDEKALNAEYLKISNKISNPDEMIKNLSKIEENYRCYNILENELKLAYINDKQPADQPCKEKYVHLFKNEEEFMSYYLSNGWKTEIPRRESIYKKYLTVLNSVRGYRQFEGCRAASDRQNAKDIAEFCTKELIILPPLYSEKLIDRCLHIDDKMAKEYNKNGAYFKGKIAFFESYTSDTYKQDLKAAKKSK